jgi:peptidyl-prolyl cis-trans isomerase SurA
MMALFPGNGSRNPMKRGALGLVASIILLCTATARAEIVDEIVAKVNDDIVTKSELETEEQGMLQELYRRYSGTELDSQVKEAKTELLRRMIDRKVLIQRAAHIFDVAKMQEFYIESFKEQQNIKSDKELEKLLAQQDMTMADMKKRLVDEFAPQQVIRAEVAERIAVSEKDERTYYGEHTAEFKNPRGSDREGNRHQSR